MATQFRDTITIKFKPEGDTTLTNAIKKLDEATRSLLNSQAKLVDKEVQRNNIIFKGRNQLKAMFLDLKKVDSGFKEAGVSTELFTRALKGDRVALRQVREATKKLVLEKKKLKKGILDTEHSTRILGGSFAVLRSRMLLASFAAGIFGSTIGKLTKLLGEQEKAEKKLETALGKRSKTLLAFASAQQKVTTFGDEETITAMSLVAAYTDNEKAVARLTKASMDLAVAKGMDLNAATDLVTKSVFSSTNALSRYGVTIEGTQGSVQRLESATSALTKLYGGQAEANAETFLGSMKQLNDSVGDLGEKLGSFFIPAITISAKGIKAFADSIDTEEIKAYGTALLATAGVWIGFTHGTTIATKAMVLFNKVSKKNLAIFAGMVAVGALIDKFNIFADSTSELDDELKKLEGTIEGLGSKLDPTKQELLNFQLATQSYSDTLAGLSDIEKEEHENLDKLKAVREELGITVGMTEDQFAEKINSNIVLATDYYELQQQGILIEEKKSKLQLKSVSNLAGAMSSLLGQSKQSALASKRLSQVQAVIDTYAAGNVALKSAPPPFNYIAMAAVIAQGLANVAQIEAQKFHSGGLASDEIPAVLQKGEFVMSKSAVESIGLETLNQMNRGGGAGVTVNISGGIVQEDYVSNTLIPEINRAVSLGSRINA